MPNYNTVQGDTWDVIALKVYGNEQLMHHLINANPFYREMTIFPADCALIVPLVVIPTTNQLPPWKR